MPEADAKLYSLAPANILSAMLRLYARRITRYKVHKGDTVETVADNFGVPAQMVRRWNGIRGDSLRGRRVLAVHLPVAPNAAAAEVATARSVPGKNTESQNHRPLKKTIGKKLKLWCTTK